MGSKIILYTTGCEKCSILKKKLEGKNIPFETISDENILKEELFIKRGFKFMPILQVNDKFMEFIEANKWVNNYGKDMN